MALNYVVEGISLNNKSKFPVSVAFNCCISSKDFTVLKLFGPFKKKNIEHL